MVAPTFGFSVGDFVAGTKLLISAYRSLKDTGGASSKYAAEASFLVNLGSMLQRVQDHADQAPDDDGVSKDIIKLLKDIETPMTTFHKFLQKYEASLSEASGKNKLQRAPKAVTYTMKELSGKVEKLRVQIEQPLQAINSLLSLQVINSIEKLSDQPLRPADCAQLVDAIVMADIPAALNKEIQALKSSVGESSDKQDHQLQALEDLKTELNEEIQGFKDSLSLLQGATSIETDLFCASQDTRAMINNLTTTLKSTTGRLEEEILQQKELIQAIKHVLEDKATDEVSAVSTNTGAEGARGDELRPHSSPTSTTSSAASMALNLLSVVTTSIFAVAMSKRSLPMTSTPVANHHTVAETKGRAPFKSPPSYDSDDCWVCCACRRSGLSPNLVLYCLMCSHFRCRSCRIEKWEAVDMLSVQLPRPNPSNNRDRSHLLQQNKSEWAIEFSNSNSESAQKPADSFTPANGNNSKPVVASSNNDERQPAVFNVGDRLQVTTEAKTRLLQVDASDYIYSGWYYRLWDVEQNVMYQAGAWKHQQWLDINGRII